MAPGAASDVESAPLLPDAHGEATPLETCCRPRSREQRAVQSALNRACRPPSLIPTVPRNSPVLLEFLKEKLATAGGAAPEGGEEEKGAGKATGIAALPAESRRAVHVVFALAFLSMAVMTTVTPTLLLYLQHVGFAGRGDLQFYVSISVIGTSVPVAMHVLLAKLADVYGAPRSLGVACVAVALGLLGMAVFDESRLLFATAYLAYSVSQSLRPVRTIILSDVSSDEARTEVMSLHALMTPLGALFGPAMWLLVQRYKGDWALLGTLRVNRYTIDYAVAGSLCMCMAAVAFCLLPNDTNRGTSDPSTSSSSSSGALAVAAHEPLYDSTGEEIVHVHLRDGRDFDVHPAVFRRRIFIFFTTIMFLCNTSMGLYMVSFQPIMVMKGATGHDLGLIYELISVLAIVPPLLVAFLSKRLQDRQILLIGLVVKIVGISMFLPLFGPVPAWSVVVGYVLLIKASIFFFTAAMSLFTKLLGRGQLLSGTLMGALSSASALGPALAQLFFADEMMKLFGGWTFGVFMLPVLAATALVCWPWFWARLDPDTEFHTVLRNEYAATHRRDRGNGAGKGS